MKICEKHLDQLTGDDECLICKIQDMYEIIFQLNLERSAGNQTIKEQQQKINELENGIKELQQPSLLDPEQN